MGLVLASGSKRRRELMEMCGYDFEVVPSGADETSSERDPGALCELLALRKAEDVYSRLAAGRGLESGKRNVKGSRDELIVLGSDTVVAFENEIIGKPADAADAVKILGRLSGKTHRVYTGVAVAAANERAAEHVMTEVSFAKLTDREIEAYVASGEPFDKAGAYGIQGPFGMFVESINGNYFNVVGLPLPLLYRMLSSVGIKPKGFERAAVPRE